MSAPLAALATRRPLWVYGLTLLLVVGLGAWIPGIHIDTDPENMLPADQPDRVFHNAVEERFALHDAIVVGAVNERDENGVFNPRSLAGLHELTRVILNMEGVIAADVMSLSTVDNITQAGPGTIRFEWMMKAPPVTQAEADAVRAAVSRLPLLMETLVSGDGRAAAIYVPIRSKDLSYRISNQIREAIAALDTEDEYHITGLPVAEDTFGHDMFVQMGISAPLAGLMIFLLMWYFFRSATLVIAPMVVAMVTVIATMGLLIGLGFTVHIMSSMIPIFLMPIAVVDSVHILSEFADAYDPRERRSDVITRVVGHLFKPMLFTSVTSAAGFASLMLTPIPPVQVFGGFVAFGILLAFLLTITFIPAYVCRMKPGQLQALHRLAAGVSAGTAGVRFLRGMGRFAFSRHGWIVLAAGLIAVFSAFGMARIQINDNPVRWFKAGHEIRVADRVLNQHFAGTYDAFLVLEHPVTEASVAPIRATLATSLDGLADRDLAGRLRRAFPAGTLDLEPLAAALDDALFDAGDADLALLEPLLEAVETAQVAQRYFQSPRALAYVGALQDALAGTGLVGKTNALPDVVKVVNRELRGGDAEDYRVPDTSPGVAQALMQYQSSHRPQDLWHMVTPDYSATAIWLQLTSGDNQDMTRVVEAVDAWLAGHPPPDGVSVRWAGKTYINLVWQQAMVAGMMKSLAGAAVMVLVMMLFLFRSVLYGLLAMLPLTLTIALMYGLIGWTGKYYDMPIAVLSALTLGLSIDFAIHFLQRFRTAARELGWRKAAEHMFEEPGRAIFRNAMVIALGFTPLFAAPLVPYITVGAFMAAIMIASGAVTLLLLPAMLQLLRRFVEVPGAGAPAANQGENS